MWWPSMTDEICGWQAWGWKIRFQKHPETIYFKSTFTDLQGWEGTHFFLFFGGLLFWLQKNRDFLWISPLNHPVNAGTGAYPINLVFPPKQVGGFGTNISWPPWDLGAIEGPPPPPPHPCRSMTVCYTMITCITVFVLQQQQLLSLLVCVHTYIHEPGPRTPTPPLPLWFILIYVSTQCFHACWHVHLIHIFHAHSAWLKTSRILRRKQVLSLLLDTGVYLGFQGSLKGDSYLKVVAEPVPSPSLDPCAELPFSAYIPYIGLAEATCRSS